MWVCIYVCVYICRKCSFIFLLLFCLPLHKQVFLCWLKPGSLTHFTACNSNWGNPCLYQGTRMNHLFLRLIIIKNDHLFLRLGRQKWILNAFIDINRISSESPHVKLFIYLLFWCYLSGGKKIVIWSSLSKFLKK